MARQRGGDLFDFSNMTDDEVRAVVVEHLREDSMLDADWIDVLVKKGHVTLTGRVGTDSEVQVAEEVVEDVLGIRDFQNDLVVDELHRFALSDAADEATGAADEIAEGSDSDQQSDTADHLAEHLEDETFGTHDMNAAIRDGTTYVPPDGPRSEGYDSRENH